MRSWFTDILIRVPWLRKARLLLFFLMSAAVLHAYAAQDNRRSVIGTVVSVQESKVQSPEYTLGGSNPSDAPLTSRYYEFQVAIRIGCDVYIGRYQTAFNYLPSAFTAERTIPVRLTKHVMHFDLQSDPDLRVGIIRRRTVCGSKR